MHLSPSFHDAETYYSPGLLYLFFLRFQVSKTGFYIKVGGTDSVNVLSLPAQQVLLHLLPCFTFLATTSAS